MPKKEKVPTKMIQIPVPTSMYEQIRKIAQEQGRTIPAQCKMWFSPHLKKKD